MITRKLRHSEREITWAREQLNTKLIDGWSVSKLATLGLDKEFEKKFGKKITLFSLENWLRRVKNPEKYSQRGKGGKKKSSFDIFQKSKYILLVGNQLAGFDSEDQVKEFLTNSMVLGGIKLFVHQEIQVKCDIKFGPRVPGETAGHRKNCACSVCKDERRQK